MNSNLKRKRRLIKEYFDQVKNSIHTRKIQGKILFDIEYEDFKNESHVEQSIREIIGEGYLLNVKRYCSEDMMEAINRHYGPASNRKILHEKMAEYEGEQ